MGLKALLAIKDHFAGSGCVNILLGAGWGCAGRPGGWTKAG